MRRWEKLSPTRCRPLPTVSSFRGQRSLLSQNSSKIPFFLFILQSFQPSCVNTSAVPVQLRPKIGPAPPRPAFPTFPTGANMAAGSVHHLSLPLLLPVSSLLLSLLFTGSHALREYESAGAPSRSISLL